MKYYSVEEFAKKWNVSKRTVRNYCAQGRITGAFLTGKTWNIPETAEKPLRKKRSKKISDTLLSVLQREKESRLSDGIYHRLQIDMTYNSNHMEGSMLTHEQTRYIFETHTIGMTEMAVNIDDIIETTNHFRCIDMVIDNANNKLGESFIKKLHETLKNGTSDSRKDWFAIGDYKRLPNEVGGRRTAQPEQVSGKMKQLLKQYNFTAKKTLEEIIAFHADFETIHPFQDGNGRIGRLIMLKECLKNNIVPFIISDDLKMFYYRGLHEWNKERGFLIDTCLTAQDRFKKLLDYFRIKYKNN
ncbi:MAG TPA: Fic family protein [Candidatus Megamonas gallistercoris]|nr:Fic family protein [Candidatus Megamonas gallistercoris]